VLHATYRAACRPAARLAVTLEDSGPMLDDKGRTCSGTAIQTRFGIRRARCRWTFP
jgi:hypothetical protein